MSFPIRRAIFLAGLFIFTGCVELSASREPRMVPVDPSQNTTLDLLLNPSVDNPLLNNLAIPQEVPAQINLPPEVVENNQWKGSQCGVTKPARIVFSQMDSWKVFWERVLAPYSGRFRSFPYIDFKKFYVVGVFMGEKSSPGYEIEILSTRIENENTPDQVLMVRYHPIRHPKAIFQPAFPVHPFHMVCVPAFKGKISFIEARKP